LAHSFLLEPGRWTLEGNWLERNQMPIAIKGRLLIAWSQDNWFSLVSKLIFPDGESILGQIEGEGWIGADTIIQRYWVLADRRRSGFETFYRINNHTYHLTSGILNGHYLSSTIEAILERQL
jgi:hypothetical protein